MIIMKKSKLILYIITLGGAISSSAWMAYILFKLNFVDVMQIREPRIIVRNLEVVAMIITILGLIIIAKDLHKRLKK